MGGAQKAPGRASPSPLANHHGAPTPPPAPATPRTPQPRRAETVHSAGGVGSTLKTTDAAFVIYLADAWAARAVLGGRRKLEVTPWTTVRETKALVAKLLKIPPQRQRLFWRSTELVDARTLKKVESTSRARRFFLTFRTKLLRVLQL